MTSTFILAQGEEFIQCPYNTAHQITNVRLIVHLDKCRRAYLKDLTAESRKKCMKICRHNATHHVPAPELRFHEERCKDAIDVVRHLAYHESEEGNRKYEENRRRDSDRHDQSRSSRDSHSHHHSSSSSRKHSSSSSSSSRHRNRTDTKPATANDYGLEEEDWSSSSSSRYRDRAETKPATTNDYGLEEEDWEAESSGYTPGYDPEIKLKNEVVIYNPPGLTKSERKKFRNEVRQKAQEKSMKGEPVELPTVSTFDIKPDIKDLKIKEEGRYYPLEPGEIEDDDDDQTPVETSSRVSGPTDNGNDFRSSNDRTNNSSRQHYTSRYSNSGYSRSCWTDKERARAKEDYYPDSDDFEGTDPYL